MGGISELINKILDACKSDVLKVFIILCACLYVLGFSFNMEGYNINYANLIINLYTALFCTYAWEKIRKELPNCKQQKVRDEEATVPTVVEAPKDGITNDEKRNLILNHRISVAQYDVHTVAMMFISIQKLSEDDYMKIMEELDNDKKRFFMEYGWLYQLANDGTDIDFERSETIRTCIYEVYDTAADELCKMLETTTGVSERVYGLGLIEKQMSKSLSAVFGCDEVIDQKEEARIASLN